MDLKLFDSELKVMENLWANQSLTAKDLAQLLNEQVGWSKTTTYTVIKKCIDKGAIIRTEPNFVCRAAISKDDIRKAETEELINKLYDGSSDRLIASLLSQKSLSVKELDKLKQIVKKLD